jgi:alpha/beta superfamily hydrolase
MASRAPQVERLQLPGPAGELEALIETPEGANDAAFGVICHPHPLYGGTMDNKVVHALSRAFQELGAPTIRFNFRGVGRSAGTFANGDGETEDTLGLVRWGRERWPGAETWLAGFSFGGAVAIRAAASAKPTRLVAVAPAVSRVDLSGVATPDRPWLIVQGDADELVNAEETVQWARRQPLPPEIALLPGVEHFFHGRLHELRAAVVAYLKNQESGKKQEPG